MKMEKRTFRIGELTRVLSQNGLEIEPSVIRFWEKEFNISPKRSETGQRYYDEADLDRFIKIRDLLYTKRFTIEGARQILHGAQPVQIQGAVTQQPVKQNAGRTMLLAQLGQLQVQLKKLRDLL